MGMDEVKYDEYGQWSCLHCTFLNDFDDSVCEMCENPKPPKKTRCDEIWNYSLVKQILLFDEDYSNRSKWINLAKLELLFGRNKIQNEYDIQSCSRCDTLYFRDTGSVHYQDIKTKQDVKKQFKTECVQCKKNSFCWCCGEKWRDGHLCDSSFKADLVSILTKAETKTIGEVDEVPAIRCCPKCSQLITHTEACKHMHCSQCNTDFCFVCLKTTDDDGEWQCGGSGDICDIAPRQNEETLPNAIVINKRAFKLF